jgi:hypothetical protein
MKRIPLVAALALLFVACFSYVFTREVRASDPCFSSCTAANDYLSQRANDCYSLPYQHSWSSSCTMDSGGTPNGGYSYSCTPVCYGPCPPGDYGFGGGGEIHDYCSP